MGETHYIKFYTVIIELCTVIYLALITIIVGKIPHKDIYTQVKEM
jgi:hypothetical protein